MPSHPPTPRWLSAAALLCAFPLAGCGGSDPAQPTGDVARGAALYKEMCASCHGGAGEGGLGPRLNPWTKGLPELVDVIDRTMPKQDPSTCDAECAEDIAAYILSWPSGCDDGAAPPRRLRLLTRREYNNTVRDLLQRSHSASCSSDWDCDIANESCVAGACAADACEIHTFVYDAGASQPGSVHVAGSFNNWPQTVAGGGWAMQKHPSQNRWATKRSLQAGTYEYKFVLNDSEWIADPANPQTSGQYGNSVLDHSCSGGGSPSPTTGGSNPAQDFPTESRPAGYPFDNNADAGLVTAVHVEQYMKAAEALAGEALQDMGKLVPCDPAADAQACAAEFARAFGARAFRRPLTDAEASRYAALVTAQPDFATGVSVAVQVMLSSPYFLYRFEIGEPQADGTIRLTPFETAGVLSYMFWGSMPDDALFEAAASGKLGSPEGVEEEARRLLADARARPQIETFAAQWLGIEGITTQAKSDAMFPGFGSDVRNALLAETQRFVSHVMFDGSGKYDELLTADYTFASSPLADLYGLSGLGAEPAEVQAAPERRAGLLGHASVLASYSYPDQSSPFRRGLFVRRNLLCQTFPAPPADAATVPAIDPNATTRERFAAHSSDPACHSCHQYIDDVGFGFERFDAVGRYRDTENGKPIDASGNMNDVEQLGSGTDAPYATLVELGAILANSESAKACFAKQTYRFAAGRLEAPEDLCALEEIGARFEESGYDLQELLVAVTQSKSFTVRK